MATNNDQVRWSERDAAGPLGEDSREHVHGEKKRGNCGLGRLTGKQEYLLQTGTAAIELNILANWIIMISRYQLSNSITKHYSLITVPFNLCRRACAGAELIQSIIINISLYMQ